MELIGCWFEFRRKSLWDFASVIFSDIIFPYEYVFAATKKSYNN